MYFKWVAKDFVHNYMYIIWFWAMCRININILNKIREVNYKYRIKYSYIRLSLDIHSVSDITRSDI